MDVEPGVHRTVAFHSATWSKEGAIKKDDGEYEGPENVLYLNRESTLISCMVHGCAALSKTNLTY